MARAKVTVVGAGFVGATAAQRIAEKDLADVVLIDVVEGLPQGKALDMAQSAAVEGFSSHPVGTNDYKDTAGSDIVVVTAGLARKPGMTRDDLLRKNAEIVGGIVEQCAKHSPNAILIIVTNPLDVMTHLAWKKTGWPTKRVIGMAGVLDSARYSCFIAEELGVSIQDVRSMVLGGHGDTMVPLPNHSTVNGIPISQLMSAERIHAINERTKNGGAEIVGLLKTGSAYYAPSASAVAMVEAILHDTGRILPCCVYLQGEYGLKDVYCGVPASLDRTGLRKIIEIQLTDEEKKLLQNSADHVIENIAKLEG